MVDTGPSTWHLPVEHDVLRPGKVTARGDFTAVLRYQPMAGTTGT